MRVNWKFKIIFRLLIFINRYSLKLINAVCYAKQLTSTHFERLSAVFIINGLFYFINLRISWASGIAGIAP